MTYVKTEEVYQEWVKERRAEGKHEGIVQSAAKMVIAKFGSDALTPDVSDRLNRLNEQQFDEFTSKIFGWQHLNEMTDWLADRG